MTIQEKLRLLYELESQCESLRDELKPHVESHFPDQVVTWKPNRIDMVAVCYRDRGFFKFATIPYEEIV